MLAPFALVLSLVAGAEQPRDSLRSDVEIRSAALRHVADVRRCYEREGLTRDPKLAGSIEVTITVLPTGIVREVAVSSLRMRGAGGQQVGACLASLMRHWRFGRGAYAVEQLTFPFAFAPDLAPRPGRAAESRSGA